jgi:hypothetical protein
MQQQFPGQYAAYMARTGILAPRLFGSSELAVQSAKGARSWLAHTVLSLSRTDGNAVSNLRQY